MSRNLGSKGVECLGRIEALECVGKVSSSASLELLYIFCTSGLLCPSPTGDGLGLTLTWDIGSLMQVEVEE